MTVLRGQAEAVNGFEPAHVRESFLAERRFAFQSVERHALEGHRASHRRAAREVRRPFPGEDLHERVIAPLEVEREAPRPSDPGK